MVARPGDRAEEDGADGVRYQRRTIPTATGSRSTSATSHCSGHRRA